MRLLPETFAVLIYGLLNPKGGQGVSADVDVEGAQEVLASLEAQERAHSDPATATDVCTPAWLMLCK